MKAVIFAHHGGPEVLQYTDFPTPEPGPGEVQVRLHAAALNRLDVWVRNGWPGIRLEYPHIPGADGAGVISAIGPGVTTHDVGERVVINSNLSDGTCAFCQAGRDNLCERWALLGETVRGTYAEYVVVPDRNVLTLPADFAYDQAAAASLVFLTAWHSLMTRGKLLRGESVLIVGAGGGVNMACLQIAKYVGAKVYVVGSNAAKLQRAAELGAAELIDRSSTPDWAKAIYALTNKRGVDVVVDNVGAGTLPLSLRAAAKGGRILTVGNTGGPKIEFDNRYMFAKHLTYLGSTMGTRADFVEVMSLLFAGRLRSIIAETFALPDARRAHEYWSRGSSSGRLCCGRREWFDVWYNRPQSCGATKTSEARLTSDV